MQTRLKTSHLLSNLVYPLGIGRLGFEVGSRALILNPIWGALSRQEILDVVSVAFFEAQRQRSGARLVRDDLRDLRVGSDQIRIALELLSQPTCIVKE